jgi:hypothetical protein
MNQPSIPQLPEATFESVNNIEMSLEHHVRLGVLMRYEDSDMITYVPTQNCSLHIVRKDIHGDVYEDEDLYDAVKAIYYPTNPTPQSRLLVKHSHSQNSVSELNTAGIVNIYLSLKQNEPTN